MHADSSAHQTSGAYNVDVTPTPLMIENREVWQGGIEHTFPCLRLLLSMCAFSRAQLI
jgi:hypothetical protein